MRVEVWAIYNRNLELRLGNDRVIANYTACLMTADLTLILNECATALHSITRLFVPRVTVRNMMVLALKKCTRDLFILWYDLQ